MGVLPLFPSDWLYFIPHLDIHTQTDIAHWTVFKEGATPHFCQPNSACSRLWLGLPSFLQRKKPEDFSFWSLARLWLSASSQLWLETWLLHVPWRRILAEAPPGGRHTRLWPSAGNLEFLLCETLFLLQDAPFRPEPSKPDAS